MNANNKTLTLEQLEELHEIQCCLSAVTDLMIPCNDLHVVNRDNLALLLGYLTERLKKLTEGAE
jgi:hypothetical protein